jgi:CspA family cold shock protein
MADEKVTGRVRWFNDAKGYGFIVRDDGQPDVFVHYSAIRRDGFRTLSEGDVVAFAVEDTPKGQQAVDVVTVDAVAE